MTEISEDRRFDRGAAGASDSRAAWVPAPSTEAIEQTIRHTSLRALGFVGMLGIALIHLLDVISKLKETPYLGVMYIGLMLASVAGAFLLLHTGSRVAWTGAGLLAILTLVGFVLSRSTGLPGATADIGNWTEPLGLASMFVEGAVILLAGYALRLAPARGSAGLETA